jgi:hypothetical protein
VLIIGSILAAALIGVVVDGEPADSATTTVTLPAFAAVADAYVDASAPRRKFGTATTLQTGAQPTRWSFLRFDVQGVAGPVTRATLSLEATGASSLGFQARSVAGGWQERTVTYMDAPALGGVSGSVNSSATGRVTIDVTSLVQQNGVVDIGLSSTAAAGPTFASRESGSSRPQLEVSFQATTAPAVTLTSPAAGSSTRDRTPTFAGAAGDAAGDSQTVNVRVHPGTGTSTTPVQTLPATRTGTTWTVDAGADLADGTYTAQAAQSNSDGTIGLSSANTFSIDTVAPQPTLTSPASGSTVTTSRPTFSGAAGAAASDSSTVRVDVFAGTAASGVPVQQLNATRSGSAWTAGSSASLSNGTYTARATQGDGAGNEGSSAAVTFHVEVVASTSAYRDAVMVDVPSGYWRLGEASGATAIDQAGTSPGTYLGGVALGRPGGVTGDPDTAAAFDGVDDEVRIPHSAALGSSSRLTLEALVRPGAIPGTTATIMRKDLQYLLRVTGDGVIIFRLWKSGSAREIATPVGALAPGAWSHVAATFDGSTARIYVNGSVRASAAVASPVDLGTGNLYVGASIDYDWFAGTLDEVAVYTSALSAARVQAHVAAAALPDAGAPSVLLQTPKTGSRWPAKVAYGGRGGTEAGDEPTVSVEIYQGTQAGGAPYRTLTAGLRATGVFSVEDAAQLPTGTYSAMARQRDLAGNSSASPAVTFTVDASAAPRVLAAGDIAGCDQAAQAGATGSVLDGLGGTVLPLGDIAYPNGTYAEFDACYDPAWGRHRARSRPVPGNHEYANGASNAEGYYGFFGAVAGDPAKGYYSYDLGSWHVIALNAMCSKVGGCGAGSGQERWLREDLAANPAACTLAYWHNPRFSSGSVHGSDSTFTAFWQALYDNNADVILNGHEHIYERFGPQTPSGAADAVRGMRQFTVGTGGYFLYGINKVVANSQVREATTLGVLELTLRDGAYDWRFVPEIGKTFSDAGSSSCH